MRKKKKNRKVKTKLAAPIQIIINIDPSSGQFVPQPAAPEPSDWNEADYSLKKLKNMRIK